MRFQELLEYKRDMVTIENSMEQKTDLILFINPSHREFIKLVELHGELRGIAYPDNVYMWKAYDANHGMADQAITDDFNEPNLVLYLYARQEDIEGAPTWDDLVEPLPHAPGVMYGLSFPRGKTSTKMSNRMLGIK